ncbi:hypothetical protein L861_19680 [Litchfieldella anticariensis FP35 = DSM 16096]|uniref:N-acetyltransferase domain-containing protein n=1 Tax=Litchfieldella anticariensis (strain DSM 16096 / CECT 5854 / CIP 108499 / LMG 22089 / FP35) TaxID=1121939 RepID=S2L2I0_LITA3|nr:GNAT family N-acetyltransferase [Halomonas anticariensis]EPC01874.1 hypothetical protein L861_19680 [Halomonas anticariensis FP35 = DSM 16096]
MSHPLEILRLTADSPHASTVARWTYAEWGYLHPEESAEMYCKAFIAQCGDAGVPSVFVAMHDDRPVGTASLVEDDLSVRRELTPWLASVFVLPEWRGQGIASRLVQRVEHEARECGMERFYLFTPDQQALYCRLGWQDHESLSYRGEEVTIMTRALTVGPT